VEQPEHEVSPPAAGESLAAGWAIDRLIAAVVLTAAATMLIAWLAFLISRADVSPAVLFPLAIGAAIGGCQSLIFRQLKMPLPLLPTVILSLVLGLLAVGTQDYAGYRDYVREQADVQRDDRLAAIVQATTDVWQPMPFTGYLAAIVRRNPIWWSLDVALTLLAAAAVAGAISRSNRGLPRIGG
jgi:hypothetical protein